MFSERSIFPLAAGLLLGSFAFGYNAATAIHELGHVLAAWITGGTVTGFHLHPFSDSWAEIQPDRAPLVTHAAGVVFAPLVGGLALACVWRWRDPRALPLHLTAILAFATSGIYLLVGIAMSDGDAYVLLDRGVPIGLLGVAGVALLGVAVALAPGVVPLLGLGPETRALQRLLVFQAGIAPYLGMMVVYNVWAATGSSGLWSVFACVGVVAVAVAALVSGRTRREAIPPTPGATALALGLGAAVVLTELWVFGAR